MKNSILFLVILLIALLGGAGLFYVQSTLPDNDLLNRDISQQLLKVDSLDSSVNELVLRSRANLDLNYDMLVRSTDALQRTVAELSNSHFNPEDIKGSLLETRFNSFTSSIEIKADQVEDFKSANSVLRNSEKYAPLVGAQLAEIARQNDQTKLADFYTKVIIDLLNFTKQGSTTDKRDVINYPQQIRATEPEMPDDSAIQILEFANHVDTAIRSKQLTDQYLNKTLNTSTDDQIADISDAWGLQQAEKNTAQETLNYYTIGYVITMLALLSILAFRLRSLYTDLDKQVDAKTLEVKEAYEELHESEHKLNQSEKMASLGQLVAGVAHEINTPLSYISSNVDTIKSKLNKLMPILANVGAISRTAGDPNRDKKALSGLLKEQIASYRQIESDKIEDNISILLSDASEGIGEIEQIVNSLTNFSHIDSEPGQKVDINERLQNALKMSASSIGQRSVVTEYSANPVIVSGSPNQLNQVFTNILNNASHATDSLNGRITIKTSIQNGLVTISFSDNGLGISEENLKRVLDPFFTTKEVGEGTGLGLSIAHSIIEAHGGNLSVESPDIKGAKVIVSLPALTA